MLCAQPAVVPCWRGRSERRRRPAVACSQQPPPSSSDAEADPWRVSPGSSGAVSAGSGPAYGLAAALATCGAVENVYLTAVKLSGAAPALCSSTGAGCGEVLSSPWATWLGVPLSSLGAAAYAAVAVAAVYGETQRRDGTPESVNPARLAVLAGATTLATVSAYLLTVLATQLGGQPCPYCLTSAALSAGTLACAVRGLDAAERERLTAPAVALAVAVLVSLAVPQSQTAARQAARDALDLPFAEVEVTGQSSAEAVALAQHLSRVGARMYGAFWCSHCGEQKQMFGREAAAALPYVECFPEGYRKGVPIAQACEAQHLDGFPTWVFPDGTRVEGDQSLEKLKQLSGFTAGQ